MSPEIKINGFAAQGPVQKSRNQRNEGFEGSPITKSKSCKFNLKQHNTTELLSISFPQIYYEKQKSQKYFKKHTGLSECSGFSWGITCFSKFRISIKLLDLTDSQEYFYFRNFKELFDVANYQQYVAI